MAKKKAPGFVLEKDQKEIIDELTNEEAGIILKAIFEYETTREEPKLDKSLRIVFKQFKVKLDYYDGRYNEKCEQNRENIQNYWNKIKNTTEYDQIQSNTTATNKRKEKKIKENKNSVCSDNKIDSKNTPHTPTEIFDYCSTIFKNCVTDDLEKSCKKMFKHYESKKWEDVYDWKSKAELWVQDDIDSGKIKIIDTSRRLD